MFALTIFVKCILFHWDAFHSILISSAWRDPLSFYKFYMAKLLMPLFIASFVFITKRYYLDNSYVSGSGYLVHCKLDIF